MVSTDRYIHFAYDNINAKIEVKNIIFLKQ